MVIVWCAIHGFSGLQQGLLSWLLYLQGVYFPYKYVSLPLGGPLIGRSGTIRSPRLTPGKDQASKLTVNPNSVYLIFSRNPSEQGCKLPLLSPISLLRIFAFLHHMV